MKKNIIQCFNQGAKTYDEVAHLQKKVAAKLIQRLPRDNVQNILEIGCGTGVLSQSIYQLFPKASILLTDISSEMIQYSRAHFSDKNNISLLCIDGEKFYLPMRQFDLILSSMTFHWFNNVEKSLINLEKKLFPGGRILFSMLGDNSLIEWKRVCQNFNVEVGTPIFPRFSLLKQLFSQWEFHSEILLHSYQNGYDFIKQLKQLGAHATRDHYTNLSSGKLRKLLRYLCQPFTITYEIIYGSYIKT